MKLDALRAELALHEGCAARGGRGAPAEAGCGAEFRAGAIDIQWLERRLASLTSDVGTEDGAMLAALAAALLAESESGTRVAGPAQRESTVSAWGRAARLESIR